MYTCTKSLANEYKCEDGNDGAEKIVVWWREKKKHKNSCYWLFIWLCVYACVYNI